MRTAYWLTAAGITGCSLICAALTGQFEHDSAYARQPSDDSGSATRTRSGLVALYDFSGADGAVVKDRSGVGRPLDLRIADPRAVRRSGGGLEVRSKTVIRSEEPAKKIIDAVRRSNELTIEAWIRPAEINQSGPARIVTLSRDPNERNFTLGQDGNRFDVRLRTTKTSGNGIPSLSSPPKSLAARLTHVVYTRDRSGRARMYVNNRLAAERRVSGAMSGWDRSLHLALANEMTNDRPWLGTFHLVAVYDKALSASDVERHFAAGTVLKGAPPLARAESAQHFEANIAPLLARRCLECHDSSSKKGGLDLSRKKAALAGGDSGKAIVPGKAEDSLLWQYVEFDEMPKDRPPLPAQEKRLLREWIDAGAVFPVEAIDSSAYARNQRAAGNWVQRLTVPEYIETVRAAVGVDISEDARRMLPRDLRADGFSNTAYNLGVDLGHVEAFAGLARIIVGRMDVEEFAARYTPDRKLTEANMRKLIAGMGKWLLRGPLDDHEIAAYLRISAAVADEGGDFSEAVRHIIEAMLQSPRFIYRIEKQQGDGTPRPLGDYELASRLSYILWGGPPDEELMRAADAGELSDRNRLRAQVRRMLDDPRAIKRSARFVHEWLNLDRLDNLRPDPRRFPDWDPGLAADMREETLAFFKDVAWKQKRPLSDLLNAQLTYATPRLAEHYGLAPLRRPSKAEQVRRTSKAVEKHTDGPGRPSDSLPGLQALYTFGQARGNTIRDVSGAGEPLHLKIESPSAVERGQGRLTVNARTLIATPKPPARLIDAAQKSNAVTLEAWITPADTEQSGPARILTLSSGTGRRNFTLGQDGDRFDVRFRTTKTDGNGLPSVAGPRGSVHTRPTHVVYTRDATGRARLYIDGVHKAAGNVDGDLSNWDEGFRLALANETTKDRPWRGTFHLVAVYSRALTAEEVRSRGPGLSRYDLSGVPARGGLLTQGSVLTVGGDEASMVTRGLFVLHDLLDGHVSDPPPCVDTTPVPTKPGLSQRAIAEARIANPSCGGCHARFEPLAFGLEKFDGLGAYHEKDEHGNKLRDDGEVLFPGEEKPVSYKSSAELMDLLAESERVQRTIMRKLTQFALGRPLVQEDEPILERIYQQSHKAGGTYESLITAIVMSDLVRMTRTEEVQQ